MFVDSLWGLIDKNVFLYDGKIFYKHTVLTMNFTFFNEIEHFFIDSCSFSQNAEHIGGELYIIIYTYKNV